ncbi:glutamate/gamma-aminobutyrate family transporter YjeM [Fructilactobacillus sp. Tb1]|uniref:glutamate/gamma-aminobutyrate family transporter YjeM n=1 Tax=Fructilactobacillus sp. Tb1 TaxID=3422304 RepID=UPI003D28E31D
MEKKSLSLGSLILMIFTSVFGFANIPIAYYLMGYASIIWYILAAFCFFLPYAFIIAEFGAAFPDSKGGIYTWMSNSVNERFAFIGIFMWYTSYIIWMVKTGSAIWVPLSTAIFGEDQTSTWHLLGLNGVQIVGILACLLMIVITFLVSRGMDGIKKVTSIGGLATMSINVLLILGGCFVLILNGHTLQPLNWSALFVSPNQNYVDIFNILGFVVFAIFAFGGLEAISGLVDQTKNAKRNFPLGIIISAITITIGYSLGILMMGSFTNWQQVLGNNPNVNLINVPYIVMKNFGYQLGLALHLSDSVAIQIGIWISRYVGLAMFLTLTGAFTTLIISPLTQLVEGTPKAIWPKFFNKKNALNVPMNALIVQCVIVIILNLIISFGGKSAQSFFNVLVTMTNVAMTIPYLFIAYSFLGFKQNKQIEKPFVFYKKPWQTKLAVYVVLITVGAAIIFTVIAPIVNGQYLTSFLMVLGPVLFGLAGYLLFRRYENKI